MADTLNWTNLSNCTAVGGTLTKTGAGAADDAGAQSVATIPNDGYITTTVAEVNKWRMIGLSTTASASYTDIDFGVMLLDNGLFNIYESNFSPLSGVAYVAGDVIKIAVTSTVVTYYLNGALIYTSAVTPTQPLLADARMGGPASTLTDCEIYGHQRPVQFTDTSTTDTTSWLWLFGDASTSTSQNPTHTYALDGTYTVTLFATSSKGTSTYVGEVVILNGLLSSFTPGALTPTPGGDPQVMLRISNDGGKTWVAEVWRDAGKVGEYLRRVRWNRLGVARRRVFEISVTDPIQWRIVGCYIETEAGDK